MLMQELSLILMLTVLVVLSSCCAWGWYQLRKQRAQLHSVIQQLELQWRAVSRANRRMDKQLRQLNTRLERTCRRQQELEFKDMGNIAYSHASKLMEMGAASEDLVTTCGLSQAEARLMSLMHSRKTA